VILFTKKNAIKIIERSKWQTRRFSLSRRWKPGSEHWAQLNLKPDSRFARLLIKKVWTWDGTTISNEDVKAEGYLVKWEFLNEYYNLNKGCLDTKRTHFAVEFEVVEEIYNDVLHKEMQGDYHVEDVVMFYCSKCGKYTQHYEPSPYDDLVYGENRVDEPGSLFCAICE